jgi:GxxExxY protein
MLLARELTERVIGLAIEVHLRVKPGGQTGPGTLESFYEGCLCYELEQAWIAFQRQAGIPVTYKGVPFEEMVSRGHSRRSATDH